MIRLDNLTYRYPRGRTVFDKVSLDFPSHRRLALLGGPESGKTTLLGLLSGVIDPTGGQIERFAYLSYPAGFARAFRLSNPLRANLMFAARVYDADPEEITAFIGDLLGIADRMDRPMRDLPIPTRQAVAYALTYSLPFDTYLFDNAIGPGDPALRDTWRGLYEARTASAGAILATRQPKIAETWCDCAIVMRRDAPPVYCDDIRDAVALFKSQNAVAPAAEAEAARDPIDDKAAEAAAKE